MSSLIEWREKSETDLASSDGSASEDSGPAEIEPTKSHTLKQELLIYLYTDQQMAVLNVIKPLSTISKKLIVPAITSFHST